MNQPVCLHPLQLEFAPSKRGVVSACFKKRTLIECKVFSMKVLTGGHYFYISNWRWDLRFTWSCKPRKDLAICKAKGVPSFLSFFKTVSIGPAPGIEKNPATLPSAVMPREGGGGGYSHIWAI